MCTSGFLCLAFPGGFGLAHKPRAKVCLHRLSSECESLCCILSNQSCAWCSQWCQPLLVQQQRCFSRRFIAWWLLNRCELFLEVCQCSEMEPPQGRMAAFTKMGAGKCRGSWHSPGSGFAHSVRAHPEVLPCGCCTRRFYFYFSHTLGFSQSISVGRCCCILVQDRAVRCQCFFLHLCKNISTVNVHVMCVLYCCLNWKNPLS